MIFSTLTIHVAGGGRSRGLEAGGGPDVTLLVNNGAVFGIRGTRDSLLQVCKTHMQI